MKLKTEKLHIDNIPSIVWGDKSASVYIFVHGKMSDKESAQEFAKIAIKRGYQVLSFDLPEHGERKNEYQRCDIWNGIYDLERIGVYAKENWNDINLYGCSLGAYFSLHAYKDLPIQKCLFQSPILDMEFLIQQMFLWFDVTEEQLHKKGEIPTPIDILSWKYYCYVKDHPIVKWDMPTAILYGAKDNLQNRNVINNFVDKFGCELDVSIESEHSFGNKEDSEIVMNWLEEHI